MKSERFCFQNAEVKTTVSRLSRQGTLFAVIFLLSATAHAQYGGMSGGGMPPSGGTPGTMGTGASSTSGYGSGAPGYGHGAAIGIGVGAAAAGAATVYLLTHRTSKVTGCVQAVDDGLRLTDDKTQKTLSLVTETAGANPMPVL